MNTSTWLRYINCARFPSELNVGVASCRGRVYYITLRDIAPEEELLCFYGHLDAAALLINTTAFDM